MYNNYVNKIAFFHLRDITNMRPHLAVFNARKFNIFFGFLSSWMVYTSLLLLLLLVVAVILVNTHPFMSWLANYSHQEPFMQFALSPRPCDVRCRHHCLPCRLWWLGEWSHTSSQSDGWWLENAGCWPWESSLCWEKSHGRRGWRRGSEETWGSPEGRHHVAPLRREEWS